MGGGGGVYNGGNGKFLKSFDIVGRGAPYFMKTPALPEKHK